MKRSAPALRTARTFVAVRLAAAERLLAEAVARISAYELGPDVVARGTHEVDRAAARVRYWRELQRGASTHPGVRVCKMLGHRWDISGVDSTSVKICKRCAAVQD